MRRIVFISGILAIAVVGVVFVAHIEKGREKAPSPIFPRFASLRSGEANMRTGPGTRYPIEWVFKLQGLPVEITAKDDDDIWRHVRDSDGDEGWIHKSELSGKRTAIVTGGPHDLLNTKDGVGAVVAHLDAGVVGQVLSCDKDWCRLKFGDVKGYLRKGDLWGAYPDEIFD